MNRNRPKVLILSHMYPHGDEVVGSFVHDQARALAGLGAEVRVVSPRPSWMTVVSPRHSLASYRKYRHSVVGMPWENLEGIQVKYPLYPVTYPFSRLMFQARTFSRTALRCMDEVYREFPFDLVHAHTSYLDGTAALRFKQKTGVPYLITEHTGPFATLTENPFVRAKTRRSLAGASRVFGVSEAQRDAIALFMKEQGLDTGHLGVMYNGVDTSLYHPPQSKVRGDRVRFAFVGGLVPVKNIPILLKSFERLFTEFSNIELYIVGRGEQDNALKYQAAKLSSAPHIHFEGQKSREELPAFLRENCDILVLPSSSETFGVVLIEAMASGRPCVSTRNGGAQSIITSPDVGELCDANNTRALTDAMRRVMLRLDEYAPQVIAQYARAKFGLETVAAELLEAYGETAEQG